MYIFLAFTLLITLVSADTANILVNFFVPAEAKGGTGLYWAGHENVSERMSDSRPWFGNSDMENMLSIISPGAELVESVVPGSTFVLRSSDFTTRVRVVIKTNLEDDENRKFSISIINLALDDRTGPYPIEVKHSDGGYLWVDPAEYMEHLTDENHIFEVRDRNHNPIFSVVIQGEESPDL